MAEQLDATERAMEIQRLRKENAAILATPLLSEGSISPAQVGMMSKRQGKQYVHNAQERMRIEAQIRELQLTDEQLVSNKAVAQVEANNGRILQIKRQIEDIINVGIGKNGKLKPSYQKLYDKLQTEREELI